MRQSVTMNHKCIETEPILNFKLNPLLYGFNNVFGFLNGVQSKFPDAISLAAGMPDERYFDVAGHLSSFDEYCDWVSARNHESRTSVTNKIGQYNSSKGMINEHIAKYLETDEGIKIAAREIIVTVGAQEAFAIAISTICDKENDVILTENPCYIGVSSFARLFGYAIEGVAIGKDGIDIDDLSFKIKEIQRSGRSVKLLYVIPDYQNPSGESMTLEKRLSLLEIAELHNFLIIEDSVYNSFSYSGKRQPTLKSMDSHNRVIYIGSFSKLLFPGLRIGFVAANQKIGAGSGQWVYLIDEMEKLKGQITNNTSTISQSILAGILLRNQYSLAILNEPKIEGYKCKRDTALNALERYVGVYKESWAKGVSWNEPDGGFFIRVSLPFELADSDVGACAEQYGVIYCPMSHFYLGGGGRNEIRISFSGNSTYDLAAGIERLSLFLRSKAGH